MRTLLIRGGRIVDPSQGNDRLGDLLVIEGKIAPEGPGTVPEEECDVLEAKGLIVCPGFIDLHCHLRQPGFEEKETIASGSRAAARGGFTTLCCMPNTEPPIDTPEMVHYIKQVADKDSAIRVLPIACITRGRKGKELVEFESLAHAGAIAFSDDGSPVTDSKVMYRALEASRSLGLRIIDHCEDASLSAGGVMNEGAQSEKLGLKGIPAVAEEVMVARDLVLAKRTHGRIHIAHVSTGDSVQLVRLSKAEGVQVTAEATPHHLTLTEELVSLHKANAKVNPPLRTERDIAALIEGLKDRTIDAIATDHAPHTIAEKKLGMNEAPFGISGLETALGSLMGLVHGGRLALIDLIVRLTYAPAGILGMKRELGTLMPDTPADICIFDPDGEWVVEPEHFESKGRNTPLAGRTLKGKVMATIFGGNVVYQDESMKIRQEGRKP